VGCFLSTIAHFFTWTCACCYSYISHACKCVDWVRNRRTEHLLISSIRLRKLYYVTYDKRPFLSATCVLSSVTVKSFTMHVCTLFCLAVIYPWI
jgi:hypothetical protein